MKNLLILIAFVGMSATCSDEPDVKPNDGDCMTTPLTNTACVTVYQPVCGCDGITYSNECNAKVAGVKKWTEGACE